MEKQISSNLRTTEKILKFLKQEKNLVSINHISEKLNINWYSVRASVEFLEKLNALETFPSNTDSVLIRIKKNECKNATATN
jgi:predicted transcriptional regulator